MLNEPLFIGTLVKEWRKASSPRHARTWQLLRRTTKKSALIHSIRTRKNIDDHLFKKN
ncbi:hypothetical protein OESDEN_06137 [Oesophagostomum dentatum]|uniref:Uncharacterized protein n=1 Tax=Oesophagostomum dentatum TaxID=61180 RepID=A0A0B1TCT3_OESDE|nr:hypothetical protein OESDEN_06137 [Oesophagostomum dentatum]